MEKTAYLVTLGFECPKTGHWLPAGKRVEMTETESLQLVLSGHLVQEPAQQEKKTAKGK